MSRKVVVLSPQEWNERVGLQESLQQSYDHTHYAVTRVGDVKAALQGLLYDIKQGKALDELIVDIEKTIVMTGDISSEVRASQDFITGIKRVLKEANA